VLWLSPLDERHDCPEWLQPWEHHALERLPMGRGQEVLRSRVLLRRLVAQVLGCTPQAVPLRADPGAPPQLEHMEDWHLSLSHSRGTALVAMARQQLGVDLEVHNRWISPAMARRFFSPEEADALDALERQEGPQRGQQQRLASWLAKESLCKLLRQPLLPILKTWRYDPEHHTLHHGHGQTMGCRVRSVRPWSWAYCTHGSMATARSDCGKAQCLGLAP